MKLLRVTIIALVAHAQTASLQEQQYLFSAGAGEIIAACRMQPLNEILCSDAAAAALRQDKFAEALAQFRLGRHKDAMQTYRSMVEERMQTLYLAILYRLSPQLRAEAVEHALRANPRFALAYFLRCKIYMDQNHPGAALADFERAAEMDPKYPLPYCKMAQIYARQGRTSEAAGARREFAGPGSLRAEEMLMRQAQDVLMPVNH